MVELLSIHIPKTAGTTFYNVLVQAYGDRGVYRDFAPKAREPDDPALHSVRAIHTHYPYRKFQGYFENARRIVWLRHPIFRVISDYHFSKRYNDRNNPLHVDLVDNDLSLLEYACRPWASNVMSSFLRGADIIEFDFVGIQEFFQEDLLFCASLLNWPEIQIPQANKNVDPKYFAKLSEVLEDTALVHALAKCNTEDIALYETALGMRAARTGESVLIQETLAEWVRFQSSG